jgi:type VI secretion system protein ImpF
MAQRNAPPDLRPSLLDRLIDREPRNRTEAQTGRALSIDALKDSVRTHLEWLFNSRRPIVEPPASARHLWGSVYCYGLPDIAGLALNSPEDHQKLARMLERAITDFEPRLRQAAVTVEGPAGASRTLRFHIEALLRVEPAPARVSFDTTLELTSGEYQVGSQRRAR